MGPTDQGFEARDLSTPQAQFWLVFDAERAVAQRGSQTRQQLKPAASVTLVVRLPFADARTGPLRHGHSHFGAPKQRRRVAAVVGSPRNPYRHPDVRTYLGETH